MERLLDELPSPPRTALDVGCGHGRFAALLQARHPTAEITGVDGSAELLAAARARTDLAGPCRFVQLDVDEDPGGLPEGPFDLVTLIAVLHHVPGEARRQALLRELAARVAPGGVLALAFWRRIGDDAKRRVDWSVVGIDEAELEPGDRLLRFEVDDPERLRFSHFADDAELERTADCTGLPLLARYDADGPSGEANAYFLWRRPS